VFVQSLCRGHYESVADHLQTDRRVRLELNDLARVLWITATPST